MKNIMIFSALLLCACSKTETIEITNGYVMPDELKECKVYYLSSEKNKNIWVTVCGKNISTQWDESESCGKGCTKQVPYSTSTNDMRQ